MARTRRRSADQFSPAFVRLLDAFSQLTGMQLVWKSVADDRPSESDRHRCIHTSPYCLAVKSSRTRLPRCIRDDVQEAMARARRAGAPFVRTCHAGVTEIVVPVRKDARLVGVLFCGPTRRSRDVCPYPRLGTTFDSLPIYEAKAMAAAREILHGLAAPESVLAENASTIDRISVRHASIQEALSRMHRDLGAAHRASVLAKQVHLSVSRFVHLFKEEVGVPFTTYLRRQRVAEAKRLLVGTDMRVVDIAEAVGYREQNHFARVFRQEEGCSPLTYRKTKSRMERVP